MQSVEKNGVRSDLINQASIGTELAHSFVDFENQRSEMFKRIGVDFVRQSLDAQTKRQKVIAENIANINTQGYTAKRVKFEELLSQQRNQAQLRHTSVRHIPVPDSKIEPEIVDTNEAVSLENEMGELAKVQMLYAIEAQSLSRRFKMLKESIAGSIT